MKNKYKEVYGAAGEVLGMLLLYMQESNHVIHNNYIMYMILSLFLCLFGYMWVIGG